jgi:hypothetical protein
MTAGQPSLDGPDRAAGAAAPEAGASSPSARPTGTPGTPAVPVAPQPPAGAIGPDTAPAGSHPDEWTIPCVDWHSRAGEIRLYPTRSGRYGLAVLPDGEPVTVDRAGLLDLIRAAQALASLANPGWAAAPAGFRAHYVAAGASRSRVGDRATAVSVCGALAYIDEDSLSEAEITQRCHACERRLMIERTLVDGARVDWDMWNVHDACRPGYERFVILKALGVGPVEGMTLRQIREAPPSADAVADERLLELVYEGFVVRPGPHYLWQLDKTGATRWYDRRRP